MRTKYPTSLFVAAICVIAVGAAYIGARIYEREALRIYEDVTYALRPSAERAYQYADWHFDAADASLYDLDRAEYFLRKALEEDMHTPHAWHQLARIAFLRGEFGKALNMIDKEIELAGDNVSPSSFYVQGLILGYMGEFAASAESYEKYIAADPYNWAALNDYAWVLLQNDDAQGALEATERGLSRFPNNAWLLNTNATARFELGDTTGARERVRAAARAALTLSPADWLVAYPGNDPLIAAAGLAALQDSIAANMRSLASGGEND
jgi:tetratricopeptide (TPR) repeat protein